MTNRQEKAAESQHILVVDDQPANLKSLEQILRADYRVSLAPNGQGCLDQLARESPDLILLDVDMPLMDGLSVCRLIKANPATSMIPVIFVSALSRLSERLAGYQAGADDYVSKPYDVEELLVKIRIALNNSHDLEIARQRSTLAREEMEESLATCTELGELARFIGDSLDCDDVRTLGERMLDTFERFGLRVIVRMIASGHYISHAGEVGVLDREMMENMYGKGRMIDFGHRTLINADSVSVLVRNMPVHDSVRYQRWKENLNLLVEVVNTRICDVDRLHDKQRERERLQPLITGIHQLIDHLQNTENRPNRDQASHHLSRLLTAWESQQL
ncbi:MAG: response regulator [Candidatus Thiodiazotropha sp. (ex Dulcina madagascariensis)]|nr:response regulator [Candidatus Thiodiazotropha sp. (ex Dulcina madagascariensis)]MCU7927960.1 response regulator [Candidatus Thiodiazotropha sp. (ex Dulcina madagascariensis)]